MRDVFYLYLLIYLEKLSVLDNHIPDLQLLTKVSLKPLGALEGDGGSALGEVFRKFRVLEEEAVLNWKHNGRANHIVWVVFPEDSCKLLGVMLLVGLFEAGAFLTHLAVEVLELVLLF